MKTNSEIFDLVMERKGEYETRRSANRKRIAAAGVGVIAVALCVGIGVAAQKGNIPVKAGGENETEACWVEPGWSGQDVTGESAVTQQRGGAPAKSTDDQPVVFPPDQSGETTQAATTVNGGNESCFVEPDTAEHGRETTTAVPKDGAGSTYGGVQSSGGCIPVVPAATGARPGVKVVGEKITDAEAKAYLRENTWIGSALAASGVPADNIRYSETGYCHVSYDGTEGKQLELRQNFRDYLAYSDSGKLIAIITLTKENGQLSATPAFGGPWFDKYDAFLNAHKGEELLYVYAGFMEIIITPDNQYVNPQGTDVSAYFEGVEKPYAYFYCDAATYTP